MSDRSARVLGRCVGVLVFAAASAPPAAWGQSLQDALVAAYEHSPQLEAERAQLRAVDEREPQALANTRPTITLTGSDGTVHERTNEPVLPPILGGGGGDQTLTTNLPRTSYGVTLTQPLYRGGQTLAQFRQAKALIAAERARLAEVEAQVLLQAATDYADVAQATAALDLGRNRVETLTQAVKQAQGRYDQGALTRADLAQAEAVLADARAAEAQARLQLGHARAAFQRDTGLMAGAFALPAILPTPTPSSLETASQAAMEASPQVVYAQFAVEAARQQVRMAEGQALPTVSLQGVLEHQEGSTFAGARDDVEALVVQVRAPIYAGGALASQTRAARDTVEVRRSQLDQARDQARYAAEEAWARVAAGQAGADAYAVQAAINEVALTGARLEMSSGSKTLQDVLNAEQTLFESRLKLLQARHDAMVARFTLAAATGRLDARALKLPVTYYDPEKHNEAVRLGPGR